MPSTTLFSSTLLLGTLISLRSSNWLYIWMGLELNLISFIPLISSAPQARSAEGAMTYFIAQAMGSGLLLLGSLSIFLSPHLPLSQDLFHALIFLSLLTKLGMPPCHFWFPSVISLLSWPLCLLLTTWQKITPLAIIFHSTPPSGSPILLLTILLGSSIRSLGGLNQTRMRPLIAYSSIGHITWILVAASSSYTIRLIYLTVYILTSIPLMLLLWICQTHYNLISSNIASLPPFFIPIIFILILSLGGLPPFLGFYPKWLVVESACSSFTLLIFITLTGSLINLYFYLNLIFINLLYSHKLPFIQTHNTSFMRPLLPTLSIITALTLGIGPSLFLFFYALTLFH